eukprot:Rhum_TRINITY_DN12187_c0_g2::Rhum_TRINITY_DN12187_c0_g2_i1::g.49829::m.49829
MRASAKLWADVEDELRYPRDVLKECWEGECVVVFSMSGRGRHHGGDITVRGLQQRVSQAQETRDHVDCCKMEGGVWSAFEPEAAGDMFAKHADDAWSLRFAKGHEVSESAREHTFRLQTLMAGHPVGSNVYVTPAGEQSFPRHIDPQNIFVTQVKGQKTWVISNDGLDGAEDAPLAVEGVSELPPLCRGDEPDVITSKECREVTTSWGETCRVRRFKAGTVTLSEGDRLYLPRGYAHFCRSGASETSIHLTVDTSVNSSYAELLSTLRDALDVRVGSDPALQQKARLLRRPETPQGAWLQSLPFGFLFMAGGCYGRVGSVFSSVVFDMLGHVPSAANRALTVLLLCCLDDVVDWMAEAFFASSVPPPPAMRHMFCRFSLCEGDSRYVCARSPPLHELVFSVALLPAALSMLRTFRVSRTPEAATHCPPAGLALAAALCDIGLDARYLKPSVVPKAKRQRVQ